MNLLQDLEACHALVRRLLSEPGGVNISRIGGSDTNAVAWYLEVRARDAIFSDPGLARHLEMVKRYNGFYARGGEVRSFLLYLDRLIEAYERAPYLTFCNFQLLSLYFPESLHESFFRSEFEHRRGLLALIQRVAAGANRANMPYGFIETLTSHPYSLFNLFSEVLSGKTVLVVSPFSASIAANFGRRRDFFRAYDYPDFDLLTCDTPITYLGLPDGFYPHRDWFETVEALKAKVSALDFDVALLSCGSYAMPLGNHIAEACGKKAVYVGGILQLYFGVMGRRYEASPFFLNQINAAAFIRPLEAQRYMINGSIAGDMEHEGFGAYF